MHRRTSCPGQGAAQLQHHAACPAAVSGPRPRCRAISSPGNDFRGPLPPALGRTCSTSGPAGKPSVRVASASSDSEDMQGIRPWRREAAARTKSIALPAPLDDAWAQLLQLLGLQSSSDYEFRIYKSEVVQPPPTVAPRDSPAAEQRHRPATQAVAQAAPEVASTAGESTENIASTSTTAAWTDFGRIRKLAIPLMAQNVFEYLMTVVCTVSIGHLGAAELAASSLANSVYIVTGLSMALGLSSAMETLCGQAYGAKEYKTLGEVLQRALLVCWVACIPVALLWTNSTSLMLAVGQSPAVSAMAGRYLLLTIPCLFLNIGTDCMKKYLQAQHIVSPGMYANAASTLLAPLFFHILVTQMGLGLDGAAMAFVLCQLVSFVGVGGFIAWHAMKHVGSKTSTWGGFSATAAFSKWWEYLRYGVPAMLMISLEWWVYQIPIVMIGWLPDPQAGLGVGGICVAFNGWAYMCALGLSQAVNTLVSNSLGAGDGEGAKRATVLGLGCMVILEAAVIASVLLGGETLIRCIASDPAIVSLAMKTLPVMCGVMLMDGLNTLLYSVVRGSGEQAAGSLISGSYLVLATALTYGLNFALPPHILHHLPLLGSMDPVARIWMGVVLGAMCQFAALATYISKWDWTEQARRATERLTTLGGH